MSTNSSEREVTIAENEESQSLRQSRWSFLPVVAFSICFYTAVMSQYTLLPQYIFHRFLKEAGLPASYSNASICEINRSDPEYRRRQEVQGQASLITAKAMLLEGIPSIIMVFIYGSYSDEMGRKLTILVPFCGSAILSVCLCLTVNLDLPIFVYYIGSIFSGFSGSYGTMLSGVFAYLADTTSKRNRSLAMGSIEASLGISVVISNLLVGYWLKLDGPKTPMIAITSLLCFSPFFMLFMKESVVTGSTPLYRPEAAFPVRLLSSLKRQFARIKAVFTADRLRGICLTTVIMAFSLHILCYVGSMGINTLYVLNKPFCWTSEYLGIYTASRAAFWQITMVVTVLLLRNKLSDWTLAGMGFGSYILYNCLLSAASAFQSPLDDILLISAAFSGLFNGLAGTMIRAICSKLAVQDEQGVIFAAIAGSETVAIVIGAAVLNPIYAATLTFYDGFVYAFMAVLSFFGFLLVIVANRVNNRRNRFKTLHEINLPS